MKIGNDIIRTFIPINLTKGKSDSGESIMRMEGIASTSSKDADGEFLNPDGFELDYFLKYGFMNWNHQTSKDPLALIGRPTKAIKKAEGLFLGCELFNNSPRAKEVYQLGEILEAQGSPLGFSIEGKVLERDPNNPKIITKAKITGCAITPNPKNTDTVASIIKGHNFDTLSAFDEEDTDEKKKSLMVDSESGKALAKEDLDRSHKKKKKKKFTKGEVMAQIFENHPELSLNTGEDLFNLISKIEKSIIMEKHEISISPEAIEKAYATLGLGKAKEVTTDVEDSELEKGYAELSKMMDGADYKKMSKEEKSDLKKKMSDTLKKMEDENVEDSEGKDDTKKPKAEGKEEDKEEESEEDKGGLKKGITPESIAAATTILKAAGLKVVIEDTDMSKGEDDNLHKNQDIVALIKGEFDAIGIENDLKWKATTTLIKGLREEISTLRGDVDVIGSKSNGRKSITNSASIEKSWDEDLEKSLGGGASDLKRISKTRDKQAILNILEETYFVKGELVNPKLGDDTAIFESSDQLSKGIIDTLAEKGFQIVG